MLSVSKLERQRTSGPQKRTKSDFMYCSQLLGASSRNQRRNPRCTDLITAFQVSALSWQPGATAAWLAVGWESGELYLYHHSSESAESSSSSTAKKCLKVDTLHAAAVFLMQWSPAGSRLVTADKNGSVVGWKVDPGKHTT